MIERILYRMLKQSPQIVAKVGDGIFVGNSTPQGFSGPKIAIEKDAGEREYHLTNQCGHINDLARVTCYHRTDSEAQELFDLVANRVSGIAWELVTWFDVGGNMRQDTVYEITIRGEGLRPMEPTDGGEGDSPFFHRYSGSLNVHRTDTVPSHT